MDETFREVGQRLKAYRMGRGLQAEEVAGSLGVSRAALYRIEAGEIIKIETLDRLASVLQTSVASLLGVGVEYYSSAVGYFERMRQVEEEADQVIAHFPPMSHLLTSDQYAEPLHASLVESVPDDQPDREVALRGVKTIVRILEERKRGRGRHHLSVVNFVSLPELERWLKLGIVGRLDLPEAEQFARRLAARREVEHLVTMIEQEPMGVQIGVLAATLPNVAFQLFRKDGKTTLGISPFRLGGDLPNLFWGVAMLTADKQPVQLYENLVDDLWRRALKGAHAAAALRTALDRSAP